MAAAFLEHGQGILSWWGDVWRGFLGKCSKEGAITADMSFLGNPSFYHDALEVVMPDGRKIKARIDSLAWTAKKEPDDILYPSVSDLLPDYKTQLISLRIETALGEEKCSLETSYDLEKGRLFYDAFMDKSPMIKVKIESDIKDTSYEVVFNKGRLEGISKNETIIKEMCVLRPYRSFYRETNEYVGFPWIEYEESLRPKLPSGDSLSEAQAHA